VAAALLVLGEVSVVAGGSSLPQWVAMLLTAAYTAPLAWRRYAPVTVAASTFAMVIVLGLLDTDGGQPTIPIALALAAFTLGSEVDAPKSWVLGVASIRGLWAAMLVTGAPAADLVIVSLLYGVPAAVGTALRSRDKRAVALARRTELAEAEREQQARVAAAAERARIARELHDVVAHSLSVVALQTQAVHRRLGAAQAREIDDLRAVQSTAREELGEMRRLLGVLRADDEAGPLEPQPGLDQLESLLSKTRRAGLPVRATVVGHRSPLSPGIDLAAYRIIQEALTNVRRHAEASSAWLTVRFAEDRLEITGDDDGRTQGTEATSGNGMLGMRERVSLYGGELDAAPRDGGGFRVRARLPMRASA